MHSFSIQHELDEVDDEAVSSRDHCLFSKDLCPSSMGHCPSSMDLYPSSRGHCLSPMHLCPGIDEVDDEEVSSKGHYLSSKDQCPFSMDQRLSSPDQNLKTCLFKTMCTILDVYFYMCIYLYIYTKQ